MVLVLNNPERLRILLTSKLLDSAPEEAFDRFTQLAVALLDIPVSLVTLVDKDRQYFKSYYGLPEPLASCRQTPLSHSFCQYVVISRKPLVVEDARKVAILKQNPAIAEFGVIAYLGFPLLVGGQALGSFCVIDTKPHPWTNWEIKIVEELASIVDAALVLRTETLECQKTMIQDLASLVNEELVSRMEILERQKVTKQWQEHEAQFRTLANRVPIIIWQMEREGAISFFNTAWFSFTGLSEQESLGYGWLCALHPDDRAGITSSGKGLGDPFWLAHARLRLRRADGMYREMIGHGCPYTDGQGTIVGYIGTLFTITERSELERQWETFLGIVAHELKEPLTAIEGTFELARQLIKTGLSDIKTLGSDTLRAQHLQELLSQVMGLLTRNLEHVQFQGKLIHELQDLSQVQAPQLDLQMAPCDLVAVVEQIVLEQQSSHPQRVIRLDAPDESPLFVWADQQRIGQVVTNYLSNAFKYSPPEKPVEVGITLVSGSVRVWVRDYGIGLSARQQEQLWEPVRQVQETAAYPGLGLGLYICKALIQRQQGKVGVKSAPGEGSTFWFTLPLLQA